MSAPVPGGGSRRDPFADARPEMPAGITTLPASYYTDPTWFEREVDAIHHRAWVAVGRAEEVAEPGSFLVRQIGRASVVVVRDEEGRLGAFHNVCRHRGTLLCAGDAGTLRPRRLQCRYHGWTYGLDGRLLAAPHMDRVQGFREGDHPLRSVAVAEWDGHLLASLNPEGPPLAAHLEGLQARFRPWGMAELRRVERRTYRVRANWKLIIQNYSECLHCPIAHPRLHRQSHYMSGENDPPGTAWLGGRMELREGVGTLEMDRRSGRRPLPGLSPEQARQVHYYAILPNLLLNLHPDYMLTFHLWPRAVDETEIVCEWHFHPGEIARPGFDPSGAVDFWELTNRQDWELSELAQRGISSPGYVPGPYSSREELLLALDHWILERTAAGGPTPPRGPAALAVPPGME